MRRRLLILAMALGTVLGVTGCNYQTVDTTYKYDYAIIKLANDEIVEGKVESWRDFEDGDSVQVKINGETYLVHQTDATLIKR